MKLSNGFGAEINHNLGCLSEVVSLGHSWLREIQKYHIQSLQGFLRDHTCFRFNKSKDFPYIREMDEINQ